jgi:hypothetical protein
MARWKSLRSLPPPQFPDKARSSLQQDDGPPFSILGGKVFFYLGVQFIAFDYEVEKLKK